MIEFSISKNAENQKIVIHIFSVPKWIFLHEITFGDLFVDKIPYVSVISPGFFIQRPFSISSFSSAIHLLNDFRKVIHRQNDEDLFFRFAFSCFFGYDSFIKWKAGIES